MTRPASRTTTPAPCAKGVELWGYLDGELPASRARVVARHVTACASCRATAERLRALLEECRSAGCQQLPADVRARATARIRELLRRQAATVPDPPRRARQPSKSR